MDFKIELSQNYGFDNLILIIGEIHKNGILSFSHLFNGIAMVWGGKLQFWKPCYSVVFNTLKSL
jgi:hypothetical protein